MLTSVALLALVAQAPAQGPLRRSTSDAPDSTLVATVRNAPLAMRERVGDALRAGDLTLAGQLAAAHAVAWQDSFLLREVARFVAWPPELRAAKLAIDSLRRAGVAAYGSDGADAAIAIWRNAYGRARALGDTALMGAILGNIGVGLWRSDQPDSADAYLRRAVELSGAVGDRRVEANAATALGAVADSRGDLDGALDYHRRALALHERIGDTRGIAADHNNLGLLVWATGDLAAARRQFEAALAINRRDGRDDVAATNLVNLAGLATLSGDFEEAERLYREALGAWRAREEWAETADALRGLGQLELRRGEYAAAATTFGEALEIHTRTGPASGVIEVRRWIAATRAAQGDLQGALDALRDAEDAAAVGSAADATRAGLVLARADLALQLNTLADAERLYARAEDLYREVGDVDGQAEALHGRGVLLLVRDDYAGAQAMFDGALRRQLAGGSTRSAGLTRLALGEVARARGDTALARRHLVRSAADLERVGDPVGVAAALGELGGLEAERGLPAAAEAHYRQALARIDGHVAPEVAWRLYAGLAHARRARGAPDDAAQALRLAVEQVEQTGRSLTLPERRAGFLADKWDVYAELTLLERDRGRPGVAFAVSEQLRAREMLDLLGQGRIGPPADADPSLVAREQDLRRRIAELTSEMEGPATAGLRGPALTAESGGVVREAMLAAQGAYADLLLEMRERAPRHGELISRETADWHAVAQRLGRDEAMIEYLVSDSGSVAFVIAGDSLAVVDLGIGKRDLARLVAFARGTVESSRSASDSLWRAPFRRLHRHLIAPVEQTGLLAGTTRLVVVPHAELHYLPFAALLGDRGPLVDRYEVVTTPSATVWLALGDRPGRPSTEGVLAVAPRPDALPASRREVEAVARLAGRETRVLIGARATEAAFLREASDKRILHLATYGVLNKHNPLFSFVEFAPDDVGDGRLEVHEILGLELHADLVVLSACQTGLGSGRLADVPPGDDWVGLTRAFLHAGAKTVVATLWAIEDQATSLLMERFHGSVAAGTPPAQALSQAQRAMLREPVTAHPFYWAGFVVAEGQGVPR